MMLAYLMFTLTMDCRMPKALTYFFLSQTIVFIYLFGNFYLKAYSKPKKMWTHRFTKFINNPTQSNFCFLARQQFLSEDQTPALVIDNVLCKSRKSIFTKISTVMLFDYWIFVNNLISLEFYFFYCKW